MKIRFGSLPEIVQAGHPVLREPAMPVDVQKIQTPEIQSLIKQMIEVMHDAPGVGLAAPQIGVGLRIIVLEDQPDFLARLSEQDKKSRERFGFPLTVIINPRLTLIDQKEGEEPCFFEGCLSVKGYVAKVRRNLEVIVEGLNEKGEPVRIQARGWSARILQHEVDHLNGMLFVDRMDTRTLSATD